MNAKRIHFIEDVTDIWDRFDSERLYEIMVDDQEEVVDVEFILGYDPENLYLFVRTDQEELKNRDRAYQNGDGFHFVLGKPDGERTDEFHVIAVSPMNEPSKRSFIWYHDIDFVAQKLDRTEVRVDHKDGKYIFMVKVPFDEIEPIQPLLLDSYGFNLAYVQAVDAGTNIYILEKDMKIQSEQSLRKYQVYDFEEPESLEEVRWNAILNRIHHRSEQELKLLLGAVGVDEEVVDVIHVTVDGNSILDEEVMIEPGLNRWSFDLDVDYLEPGKYVLQVEDELSTLVKELDLTVYDMDELTGLESRLEELSKKEMDNTLFQESLDSLSYLYNDVLQSIEELKPYETFEEIGEKLEKLSSEIGLLENGDHLFGEGEVLRMAYRTGYDDTLQPYSLYIPENVESLMVFLHGSGTDDRSVFKNQYIIELAEENDMMILAPYARGTSHAYSLEESLEDVKEVTERIKELFSVGDLLLAGFSMGGYGVLRNYEYCPGMYDGLVVISGIYSFKDDFEQFYEGMDVPDYSKRADVFADIPMIFFHGKEDKNCSYAKMSKFVEQVRALNHDVKFVAAENRGHSGLTKDWLVELNRWISELD